MVNRRVGSAHGFSEPRLEDPVKKVLIIYYSNSGDVERVIRALAEPLNAPGVQLDWQRLQPAVDFPYPWHTYEFFDVFPETVVGDPQPLAAQDFDPNVKYDLIIIGWQVWFLRPSLPIQAFFRTDHARALRDTRVVTVTCCRRMWYSASQRMKKLISDAGGVHLDNVVITHQGPALATFVTTPRMLLTGKRNRVGFLPPAGLREEDIAAQSRFGRRLLEKASLWSELTAGPLLTDLGAVRVDPRDVIPERIGSAFMQFWALIARFFGKRGSWSRRPIIHLFATLLLITIPAVLLLSFVAELFFGRLWRSKVHAHIKELEGPTGR